MRTKCLLFSSLEDAARQVVQTSRKEVTPKGANSFPFPFGKKAKKKKKKKKKKENCRTASSESILFYLITFYYMEDLTRVVILYEIYE